MYQIAELGRFPVPPSPENIHPRPDRRAVASVLPHDARMRVGELSQSGWRYEAAFSEIFPASLAYSPTGRLAYIARESGQQFVVVNGEVQQASWDGISNELGWSSGGEQYNYVGKRGAEIFVVGPDNTWKITDNPLSGCFTQNQDGSQIAWLTQAKQQKLFVNGQLHWEAQEFLENPLWSPNGERLAFAFVTDKGIVVRVDKRDFGPYPGLNKGMPVWSPDSKRCGWVIPRKRKSVVVIDGEEIELPFSVVQGGTLSFSPDGSRWALVARAGFLNLKGCVVIDGQSQVVYTGLGMTPPAWNPAGDALAYFAATGLKTTFIVCDGRQGQRCTAFIDGSLTWNPDGTVVGCIAQQDQKPCLILEGRDGRSLSLRPDTGHMLRGEKLAFDDNRSLHDLGFRDDFSAFIWSAQF